MLRSAKNVTTTTTCCCCCRCIDPENWCSGDVRRWLNWLLRQYNRSSLSEVLTDDCGLSTLDGAQLCQLSIADVHHTFPRDAGYVLAELQLWKNFGPLGML